MTTIGVLGMGTYLPLGQITNADVARSAGVTERWIIQATGIKTRYTAAEGEAASDLGFEALKSALAASDIDADRLDLIVVTTSTPDDLGPATACRIQERIGASSAVAFDMNAACSGWLFGVDSTRGWFATRPQARYAAVITVDTYTKFLNMADRSTAVLFSDGAVATILGRVEGGGIQDVRLHSNGTHADSIHIPEGGSRRPIRAGDAETQKIVMNGRVIRDFASEVFPATIREILSSNDIKLDDIDMVVAHQPNPALLGEMIKKAGIPEEKVIITGREVGNIGCACTPYALAVAATQGRIHEGSLILVASFGAGMTWGGALMTWSGASVIRAGAIPEQTATAA